MITYLIIQDILFYYNMMKLKYYDVLIQFCENKKKDIFISNYKLKLMNNTNSTIIVDEDNKIYFFILDVIHSIIRNLV